MASTQAHDDVGSRAEVRAAVVDAPGAAPRMGSVVLPPRTPGTTLVAVVAAPLNPLDLVIASGTFHSARHEAPYVPGSECVGVVLDSDRHQVGSWVYAECHAAPDSPGAFAQRVLVDDDDVLPLPEGLDPVRAAAVGNSGTAAFIPLVEEAALGTGETVLVLGATGAVGQLAIQVAYRRGAGRVVGVARDRAALERLPGLGADAVVELRAGESAEELAERLREVTGPVDVVLDGVYGVPLEAALQVCAPRARVVNVGNPAGATARIPAGLLRGKQLTLSGFAGLHTSLRAKEAALSWLWSALARGELRVDVRTFPLDELPSAWRTQAVSPHAKCVVLPQDGGLPEYATTTSDRRDRSTRP
ncbi:zinc-binding alcohol dehydrogenase family protein [Streptomyces sp. NBC_00006]|uniref:quinone oxidoreductase family protein n=1 Tax=unclassified Streptomyces TaxID=2593676 RepID=UPI00225131DE|nr:MULTISPECIES: zinc-binding alcohol dehydrogenase family protein [unclassified Streptomyces]MCX5535809.1 zinc-binding alcohol dehydrogenase family protein [Streptomyces sp. NBC_00006]